MPIEKVMLRVSQGRGKDSTVIGEVEAYQLQADDIKELTESISEMADSILDIDAMIKAFNSGLAVHYRSPLHRPESKINKKLEAQALDFTRRMISAGLSNKQIQIATSLPDDIIDKLRAEVKK